MQSPARLACPICQEEHIKLAAASQVASCGHRFCTQCIEKWAASCSSCPLCKQEMGALLPLPQPHSETGGAAPAKRRLVPARQLELNDEFVVCLLLLSTSAMAELNLRSCGLTAADLENLALALKDKTHNITAVDLSDNALDNSGGAKVLEYLLENDLVKRLVLNDNDLGDDIAEALAKLLQTNSTLEQLELQGNSIYTEGMACLATSLPKNRVLQHLDLGHNQLGIHGAELLAPGLPARLGALTVMTGLEKAEIYDRFFEGVDSMEPVRTGVLHQQGRSLQDAGPAMDKEIGLILASKVQLALILPVETGPETRAAATLTALLREIGEDPLLSCCA
ncbi:Protein NLRC3 [Symbiodinium microadriaticum]|uniref:Protein NLRC3 n=1 Tax=Symbiodinium microadriaticum TaxID=2951 RepID=A0A1Q9DXR9_SYMMI|nr:Protein NLRC3 [Symbiodinium microadriaticum]